MLLSYALALQKQNRFKYNLIVNNKKDEKISNKHKNEKISNKHKKHNVINKLKQFTKVVNK